MSTAMLHALGIVDVLVGAGAAEKSKNGWTWLCISLKCNFRVGGKSRELASNVPDALAFWSIEQPCLLCVHQVDQHTMVAPSASLITNDLDA